MFDLEAAKGRTKPLRIVLLGAHADDVEIGAGGTLLRLLSERPRTSITSAVFTGSDARADEARAAAADLFEDALEVDVLTPGFRDGYLPYHAADVKAWAQEALSGLEADLVLTHRRDDAHQDHRFLSDLAWQLFRGATIVGYEIPKWDGDLGQPNAYVALEAETLDRKIDVLGRHFSSQHVKRWYDGESFRSLARLRGIEAGVRYAEGFTCRKLTW
ncbi:PIG-L deacetylase family protein [Rubrivirga sp.]|uniref:PIG-L deacetylase family protein n=1 Tax=Rubrivirga sp. TaxID=1885344 RepID=UPI003C749556